MITDPGYRQAFRTRVRQGNRWVVPLYRLGILPLFGMSKQVMLLITKGRKSHKPRYTPIGYFQIDRTVSLLTGWGKKADWYKNMLACPEEVFLQVGFHRQRAIPEIVEDPEEILSIIQRFIQQNPQGARGLMGWEAQDRLETADFSLLVEKVLVIRFHTEEERFK
jgi:deazaflavin-dependent oxidoreductase (nitroreductase family)